MFSKIEWCFPRAGAKFGPKGSERSPECPIGAANAVTTICCKGLGTDTGDFPAAVSREDRRFGRPDKSPPCRRRRGGDGYWL